MRFDIHPYEGAGELHFGMIKEEVRTLLGFDGVLFKRNFFEVGVTEQYESLGCFVIYNEQKTIEAFEFSSDANLVFQEKELFKLSPKELIIWIQEIDKNVSVESDGFTSLKLGIGGFVSTEITDREKKCFDSIIVFKKGYYS